MTAFTALILAGSRGGVDPVAAYAGVAHKALIPIAGRPMLTRVIDALKAAGAARVAVCAIEPATIALATTQGAEIIAPEARLGLSVQAALDRLGAPLLVTTADHALLQGDWVRHLIAATPPDADLSLLMAERRLVEAAAPGVRRTYYRFADGAWSGCNLFWLATPEARAALDVWQRVEAHRKQPWRIARLIGLGTLANYLAGRLTIGDTIRRLGVKAGINAAVVASRDGRAAIDVDKPEDLDLVRALLAGDKLDVQE